MPLELPTPNEAYDEKFELLRMLPVPVYVTELHSADFLFVNELMAELLNYEVNELLHQRNARTLYANPKQRDAWSSRIREEAGNLLEDRAKFRRKNGQLVSVLDIARQIEVAGKQAAIGILINETDRQEILKLSEVYKSILDHEWTSIGVNVVNRDGRVEWINRGECRILAGHKGQSATESLQKWLLNEKPDVAMLSALDLKEFNEIHDRVDGKIREGVNPSKKQHKTFVVDPRLGIEDRESAMTVAVNIDDHFVTSATSEHGLSRIVTVVREEKIQESIRDRLIKIGPRNPLLASARVRTFVKKLRKHLSDAEREIADADVPDDALVFVWVNEAFEVELLEQKRIDSRGEYFGKEEKTLYPSGDYKNLYSKADRRVLMLEKNETDERIEDHPDGPDDESRDPVSVQVLKMPLYDTTTCKCIGVQGFFWEASDPMVYERLANLFQPWSFLDTLDLALASKDEFGRFIYANDKFCADNGKSLHEVIGFTDRHLFPINQAKLYEEDDEWVRKNVKWLLKSEPHPSDTDKDRFVTVLKMPVPVFGKRPGIHFIYWPNENEGPLAVNPNSEVGNMEKVSNISIDWKTHDLIVNGRRHRFKEFDRPSALLLDTLLHSLDKPLDGPHLYEAVLKNYTVTTPNQETRNFDNWLKRAKEMLISLDPKPDLPLSIPRAKKGCYQLEIGTASKSV